MNNERARTPADYWHANWSRLADTVSSKYTLKYPDSGFINSLRPIRRQPHCLWDCAVLRYNTLLYLIVSDTGCLGHHTEYWNIRILSFEIGEYWILSSWSPRILKLSFWARRMLNIEFLSLRILNIATLLTATEYWTLRIVGPEYWILSFWGAEYWILTQAWWSQYSVWWPHKINNN